MKVEEIRVQISSINDELKDTVKEVNTRHGERDLLLKEIQELKLNKTEAERLYNEEKDRLASIRYPQEQEIKALKAKLALLEIEQNVQKTICHGLTQKEADIREKVKGLKEDKNKLLVIRQELEEAEKNRPLIELVKKELLETIDKFNEAKVDLDVAVRERERTQNTSKAERVEHQNWVAETKAKINERYENCKILRLDWESKHKDLRIIRARLKKLWPKDKPFPKLDW